MSINELRFMYRDEYTEEEIEAKRYNLYREKNLQIRRYDNGVIVPEGVGEKSGVYNEEGKYVVNSGNLSFSGGSITIRDLKYKPEDTNHILEKEEIEKIYPFPVIFVYVKYHYGHFLMDTLSHLWENEFIKGDMHIAVVIDQRKTAEYMMEVMELLEIDKGRIILIDKVSKFDSVYIPDFSYFQSDYITKEYGATFDKIIGNVKLNLPVYEKIYFSRVHFTKGGINRAEKGIHREYGEKKIEKVFEDNGFKVFYPEELSLKEQIYYINNCKVLVTTNGTIAHNILFAKEGTDLIIINRFPMPYFGNWHQKAINELRKINCVSIDAYAKVSYRGFSRLIFSDPLLKFFKEKEFRVKYSWGNLKCEIEETIEFYARFTFRKLKSLIKR